MKKLKKVDLEQQLEELDNLSIEESDELKGGYQISYRYGNIGTGTNVSPGGISGYSTSYYF
jgi:hypothetical protein